MLPPLAFFVAPLGFEAILALKKSKIGTFFCHIFGLIEEQILIYDMAQHMLQYALVHEITWILGPFRAILGVLRLF